MTESAEADIRQGFRRGALVELSRQLKVKRRSTAVRAKIVGAPKVAELPSQFDVLPVVRRLYSVWDLLLSAPNPAPLREYVGEMTLDAQDLGEPASSDTVNRMANQQGAAVPDRAADQQKIKEFIAKVFPAGESRNGDGH